MIDNKSPEGAPVSLKTNKPKVSVIIPCYNQGQFIDEAVNSVLSQTFQGFEIIIINDGSTDDYTNNLLKNYNKKNTRVFFTENQGVAKARNYAIEKSLGEYILPIDADDYIDKEYLSEAVKILDENNEIGIVGCRVKKFGKENKEMKLDDYSLEKILIDNMFVCSSFFRKSEWQKTTGYNPNMIHGWEDWDFWLSIIELGKTAYRIPKIMFFYRTKNISRAKDIGKNKNQLKEMYLQIYKNHKNLYIHNMDFIMDSFYSYKDDAMKIRKIKNNRLYFYINKICNLIFRK